jgi:hypothetical protein
VGPWAPAIPLKVGPSEAGGDRHLRRRLHLLFATLDAAFDAGFISVADDGLVLLSPALDADARGLLGLDRPVKVRGIAEGHRQYLGWHRARVLKT